MGLFGNKFNVDKKVPIYYDFYIKKNQTMYFKNGEESLREMVYEIARLLKIKPTKLDDDTIGRFLYAYIMIIDRTMEGLEKHRIITMIDGALLKVNAKNKETLSSDFYEYVLTIMPNFTPLNLMNFFCQISIRFMKLLMVQHGYKNVEILKYEPISNTEARMILYDKKNKKEDCSTVSGIDLNAYSYILNQILKGHKWCDVKTDDVTTIESICAENLMNVYPNICELILQDYKKLDFSNVYIPFV